LKLFEAKKFLQLNKKIFAQALDKIVPKKILLKKSQEAENLNVIKNIG